MGDTRADFDSLQAGLSAKASQASANVLDDSMKAMFRRDGLSIYEPDAKGAWAMG